MSTEVREIAVDRGRCMGSGSCVFHAPNTFDLDDGSKVVLLDGRDGRDRIRAAVEACPSAAIRFADARQEI